MCPEHEILSLIMQADQLERWKERAKRENGFEPRGPFREAPRNGAVIAVIKYNMRRGPQKVYPLLLGHTHLSLQYQKYA